MQLLPTTSKNFSFKIFKYITISTFFIALSACSFMPKKHASELLGNWNMVTIGARDVSATEAKVTFLAAGEVIGHNGCNQYKGTFKPKYDHLNLSPLATTKMKCESDKLQVEQLFNQAVAQVEHFLVKSDTLFLTDINDIPVITFKR